jgi:hypothetical protein
MIVSYTQNQLSKELFGHPVKLRIYGWILDVPKGRFFQRQLAKDLDIPDGLVAKRLAELNLLGMIAQEKPHPSDRSKWLRRTDSRLWEVVRLALDLVAAK